MAALGSLELLAAGFSASFGVQVLPPQAAAVSDCRGADGADEAPHKLTIDDLFHLSHSMVPREKPCTTGGEIEVNCRGLIGGTTTIRVSLGTTVSEMKKMVSDKLGIEKDIRFMYDRNILDDESTVESAEILNGATINFIVLTTDRKPEGVFELDPALLAKRFDHDFTGKNDGNDVYMRGQYRYFRPCGWYRYAVAVQNVYGNNTWLGPNGIRTGTCTGEWPVSYHGTKMRQEGAVVVKEFRGGELEYINGVYSSPSLAMIDEFYAQIFEFEGKSYKIALQNRINPDIAGGHLKIIPKERTEVGADYWVSPMEDRTEKIYDVRPYGIIIKQV
ncbi:uncharacterized protein [Antedon mediterranea]|uniref:uncharacterized protein n=1 Tax=Antedon mediterranea TaxID=105859 RepID=UPI003AF4E5A6